MNILGVFFSRGNRLLVLLLSPKDKLQALSPWGLSSVSITSCFPELEGMCNLKTKQLWCMHSQFLFS